jgi:hypothetical protein
VHGDIDADPHPHPDPHPDRVYASDRAHTPDANAESLGHPHLPVAHAEPHQVPDIPDAHAKSFHLAALPVANAESIAYADLLAGPKSLRRPEFLRHRDDRHPGGLPGTAAPRRSSRRPLQWADADDLPGRDH